jgi:TatD DNase family protein
MTYYDIHAHLADPRILPRADALLAECRAHGVRGVLASAARVCEWPAITELSRTAPVYGALGLHPFFADEATPGLAAQLRMALAAHGRLVAVGEIGLDFFHGRQTQRQQLDLLCMQLQLARELDLPVVLHNRKSWSEFFAVLRDLRLPTVRGVCHHFAASIDIARRLLDKGLYLSFCGPLTYPNARRLKEVAAFVPMDWILTETDAPDLPAQAYRGGLSMPQHVSEVVCELARIKAVPATAVAAQVARNFHRLLGLADTDRSEPSASVAACR